MSAIPPIATICCAADFTCRFPLAAAAVAVLPARSCLIDGEAIVTGDDGLAVFELIRRQRYGGRAVLCAFDLLELDGQDLRRQPIEERKRILATLVRAASFATTPDHQPEPVSRVTLRPAGGMALTVRMR